GARGRRSPRVGGVGAGPARRASAGARRSRAEGPPPPGTRAVAGVGLLPDYAARELAQRIALAWGAVLLASGGAVHWGLAIAGRLPWEAARIGGALLPAPVAAAAVALGGERGLALLVVGSGGFWLYEHRAIGALLPPAYLALRRHLTLAVCIPLALTQF